MRPAHAIPLALALVAALEAAAAADEVVTVVEDAAIHWDPDAPERTDGDFVIRFAKQSVVREVELPVASADLAHARAITAEIEIEPVLVRSEGGLRPADPWTRLGSLSVAAGDEEIELVRFVTGYGGPTRYEADLTAFAPVLEGRRTLRLFVSTFADEPGWRATCRLRYAKEGVGIRRPALVLPAFHDPHLTAERSVIRSRVVIPAGLDQPRLRVLATGHATDGEADDEFTTRTHVLRIDGRPVARFRPWTEAGGAVRDLNPWAGRREIDGREVRASDYDRSGWTPGRRVEPRLLPAPELTPGPHVIELEILGVPASPPDRAGHAYWNVSVVVVADAPWPAGAGADE